MLSDGQRKSCDGSTSGGLLSLVGLRNESSLQGWTQPPTRWRRRIEVHQEVLLPTHVPRTACADLLGPDLRGFFREVQIERSQAACISSSTSRRLREPWESPSSWCTIHLQKMRLQTSFRQRSRHVRRLDMRIIFGTPVSRNGRRRECEGRPFQGQICMK